MSSASAVIQRHESPLRLRQVRSYPPLRPPRMPPPHARRHRRHPASQSPAPLLCLPCQYRPRRLSHARQPFLRFPTQHPRRQVQAHLSVHLVQTRLWSHRACVRRARQHPPLRWPRHLCGPQLPRSPRPPPEHPAHPGRLVPPAVRQPRPRPSRLLFPVPPLSRPRHPLPPSPTVRATRCCPSLLRHRLPQSPTRAE